MFKYFLLKTLRDKGFFFWTFIFPIALMSCFNVAFSNIYSSESEFDPVDAVYVCEDDVSIKGIVEKFVKDNHLEGMYEKIMSDVFMAELGQLMNDGNFEVLQDKFENGTYSKEDIETVLRPIIEESVNELSKKAENSMSEEEFFDSLVISDSLMEKIDVYSYGLIFELVASNSDCFNLTKMDSLDSAREAINSDKARVILIVKDKDVRVEMSEDYSDVEINIATAFLSTYKTEYMVIRDKFLSLDPDTVFSSDDSNEDLQSAFGDSFSMKNIAKAKADIYNESPDPFNWYYYSTIVMGIMFNILTGIMIVTDAQADISSGAMRISLSSTKKSSLLINMFMSRFVICFVITMIQIIIANVIFGIPVGKRFPELMLFDAAANLFALSAGLVCGLFFKGKITERENKANAILMASVFFSGEMVNVLPGIIQQKFPIFNEINPATVLNFTFYRLVYYSNLNSFYMGIIKILAVSVVLLALSVTRMRRQKYASV